MSLFDEFKKFAVRGNVVDLAVGVIIGASFTGIVNSVVNDVLMPPIAGELPNCPIFPAASLVAHSRHSQNSSVLSPRGSA